MKPKYGENIQLLMTDTDSFVYHIKTEDFYEDMKEMKEHYDMSEYSKESGLYDGENKKVIGKCKDESPDEVCVCVSLFYVIDTGSIGSRAQPGG